MSKGKARSAGCCLPWYRDRRCGSGGELRPPASCPKPLPHGHRADQIQLCHRPATASGSPADTHRRNKRPYIKASPPGPASGRGRFLSLSGLQKTKVTRGQGDRSLVPIIKTSKNFGPNYKARTTSLASRS